MTKEEKIIIDDFDGIKPYLIIWGKFVDETIIKIFQEFITNHTLQIRPSFRVKSNSSYLSKALYRQNFTWIKNPLEDIIDKVGTRIVMLKSEDVYEAKCVIENHSEWIAECTRDHKNEIDREPSKFEYQSVHIVVKPNQLSDSEFPKDLISSISCEIQIRSLLQHAYAEIGHDNVYKGVYRNDKEIMRKLARAMALMESTDDYFIDMITLMKKENVESKNYFSELIGLFQTFDEDFQKENIDFEFSEDVLELYSKRKVEIHKLRDFISKKNSEIKVVIKQNKSLMFNQPVILLLAYYAYYDKEFLQEKWDVKKEVFNTLMSGFSISI
jgi:putative GTP pyrophosphokinase